MDDIVRRSIEKIPFLKGKKDLKISKLGGGLSNLNYKIEDEKGAYVLRITGENTDKLGINRDVEYMATKKAGELGIGAEVMYYIKPERYLVTRFIKGTILEPENMVKKENLSKFVNTIKNFHENGPDMGHEFNVFKRIKMLINTGKENNCQFPEDFEWIKEKIKQTEQALLVNPYTPKPCHDDLLNLNFINENGSLRIIDWEYSGMGDIFFDLANFSHHHKLTDEQITYILELYFGKATAKDFARLKLMYPMSELHEAFWGVAQTGISALDEDFQGYANQWFKRARAAMKDLRWNQWLADVAKKEYIEQLIY